MLLTGLASRKPTLSRTNVTSILKMSVVTSDLRTKEARNYRHLGYLQDTRVYNKRYRSSRPSTSTENFLSCGSSMDNGDLQETLDIARTTSEESPSEEQKNDIWKDLEAKVELQKKKLEEAKKALEKARKKQSKVIEEARKDEKSVFEQMMLGSLQIIASSGSSASEVITFISYCTLFIRTIKVVKPFLLESQEMSDLITSKFNPALKEDWQEYIKYYKRGPELSKIMRFLVQQSDLYYEAATEEWEEKYGNKGQNKEKRDKPFIHYCLLYEGNHSLARCPKFKKDTTEERWKSVQHHRLCFVCLKSGHKPKECDIRRCDICKGDHHTLLHQSDKNIRIKCSRRNCDKNGGVYEPSAKRYKYY